MSYYAKFSDSGNGRFRFETRIYLRKEDWPGPNDWCVGAVIGKNPGSAKPSKPSTCGFAQVDLQGDNLLPSVRNRFVSAYRLANKSIPPGTFVKVWNLFYLCGADLQEAIDQIRDEDATPCPSESDVPQIVWFAWGGPNASLDKFKDRFLEKRFEAPFYYDHRAGRVDPYKPDLEDFARHTQGMPRAPIIAHLRHIL